MDGNLTKGPILKTLTKLAIPIMASSFLGTLYNITDMAWIGLLGSKAVAGVGGQIESISWNTADGFAAALNAFIGQNYGAGKIERVKKGYCAALGTVVVWGLFITLGFVCFSGSIASIFFHEPKAIEIAIGYLVIIGFSEGFMCVELTTVGALSGLGRTKLCSVISILFTSSRIPLAIILGGLIGLNGIWWAFSSTSIIKGIIFTGTFFAVVKKIRV